MAARALVAAFAFMLITSAARAEEAADHYFWRPAVENAEARPWAVLLPGSGGLSILGDDEHYFRAATWLNERGVDALVIDYHRAARFVSAAAGGAPRGAYGCDRCRRTFNATRARPGAKQLSGGRCAVVLRR